MKIRMHKPAKQISERACAVVIMPAMVRLANERLEEYRNMAVLDHSEFLRPAHLLEREIARHFNYLPLVDRP
jgi:hypothetical protein